MKRGLPLLLLIVVLVVPLPARSLDNELEADETPSAADVSQEGADEASEEKSLLSTEVCYGDLGCFSNSGHFFSLIQRPVVVLPESPEAIGTQFLLFTRQNPASAAQLVYNDADSVLRSQLSSRRPTKLVIHGFLGKGVLPWMNRIRSALLMRLDCNVIQVGWSGGAVTAYNQATSNTRVVGAVVARMLAWLESRFGLSRDGVHIIGFSLGAHVAGYAGERMRASGAGPVSRITGLDPAGPYFEGTDPSVRLDPTDAQFVDVVHTDGGHGHVALPVLNGGFGSQSALGHVDFYVNGGHHQPGCSAITACDHSRAPELFIAGLRHLSQAAFGAFPCDSYERFLAGRCGAQCPADGCPAMGYWAEAHQAKFSAGGGPPVHVHFLLTSAAAPFAVLHYHVILRLSAESPSGRVGSLRVRLGGGGGRTCGPHLLPGAEGRLEPLTLHRGVFGCDWAATEAAPELQVSWADESFLGGLFTYLVAMDTTTLTEMATGRVHRYCNFGRAFAAETWVRGDTC